MKPCRKQTTPAPAYRQTGTGSAPQPGTAQPAALETPVRRYTHPIRTARPAQRSTTEELLSYVLETLSHHTELLEELLRRSDGDNSDTM